MEQFYDFHSIVLGISKILIIMAMGFGLRKRDLLKREGIDSLSKILLWTCLPALMVSKITSRFDPVSFPGWWILPVFSIALSLLGLGIGYIFQKPFRHFEAGREFMSACAFQNCGYLPMALIAFACTGDFCDRMLIYIFLFLIGFNLAMWSFVPAFLSKASASKPKLISSLNPPLIATALSVISVFIWGRGWVPSLLYDPLKMVGTATFPLALIVLGGYLAEYAGHNPRHWPPLISCLFAKLIILPLLVLTIVKYSQLDITYRFFLVLEAAMPSAVSLVIIGYYKKADNRFFSSMIFYSHLFAMITVPFWFYAFKRLS